MAVRDILLHPAACLKQVAVPVTRFDQTLQQQLSDLEDTLALAPGCVGIAAPQIGYSVRVLITDVSETKGGRYGRLILINPEIIDRQGQVRGREGCLSVPDFTGNVIRAEDVIVQAQDRNGQQQVFEFSGFEARVVQHEIDHLDGLLFLDRLVSRRHDLFRRKVYRDE
jgi:peptide deformylase